MTSDEILETRRVGVPVLAGSHETNASGVSWPAVIAGAFVTAAFSLILLALGAGLGLSSISPWSNVGASASAFGTGSIIWLILLEILASALGGYIAGRLRTKWASIHTDEVYFRDTAHGFLAWCVALVVTAAFLGAAATSMVGSSVEAGKPAQGSGPDANPYFVDSMFRTDGSAQGIATPGLTHEAGVIFAASLTTGIIAPADRAYLDAMVASRTGLTTADADRRVSYAFAQAQLAAEATRKAVAHALLWTFIALLIGAFCASLAATFGGGQRDRVVVL